MKNNIVNENIEKNSSAMLQNLKDAGCDAETIQKCLNLQSAGKTREQLRLLFYQRRNLLHVIHENQKRIDCLDYLIHSIETNETVVCQEEHS